DLLPVVVELFAAEPIRATRLRQPFVYQCQAAFNFDIAFFHGQLEIEHAVPAPAFAKPAGGQFRDAYGLFDDIAHHPVDRLFGTEAETVFAPVLDAPAVHQALIHGAVVDGDHLQPA